MSQDLSDDATAMSSSGGQSLLLATPPTGGAIRRSRRCLLVLVAGLLALLCTCVPLYASADALVRGPFLAPYPVVPLYPGARQVQTSASRSGTTTTKRLRFQSADPPAAILSYYDSVIMRPHAGWSHDTGVQGRDRHWSYSGCPVTDLRLHTQAGPAGGTLVDLTLTQQSCRDDPAD